ncbi:MAG: glutamate--tRNA ligase [Patescibacteria group bacterium]
MNVRTRIAPSPTGLDLHIGNAYTALINSVIARKHNGEFIIRIEDTDRGRLVEGSEQKILASLKWIDIGYAEGPDIGGPYAPYRQSERLASYKKYAEELIEKGHAYYCYCTPERLEQMRKDQEAKHLPSMYDGMCKNRLTGDPPKRRKYVIRLNVPDKGVTTFTDLIRGEISFENKLIDDQVLLKSDGYPTYHLGVVVDDHVMNITHIIRGEEWIPSTPKHILLYKFFGWEIPHIAHVSVLRNPDRSKLSKRKNPVWVSDYKAKGFLPEAIRNYLASMAWSFPDGRDIFSTEEMIKVFDLSQLKTTAPIFDTEKLRWVNGEYIKKMDVNTLRNRLYEFDEKIPHQDALFAKIYPLVIERMKMLAEFWFLAEFFYKKPTEFEQPLLDQSVQLLQLVLSECDWTHDAMEKAIRKAAEKENMKAKDLFMQLRVAVTGKTVGPPLLESLEVLGKEETISRLS